jgi:hypothetical protein
MSVRKDQPKVRSRTVHSPGASLPTWGLLKKSEVLGAVLWATASIRRVEKVVHRLDQPVHTV